MPKPGIMRNRDKGYRVFVAQLKDPKGEAEFLGVYSNQKVAFEDAQRARKFLFDGGDPLADEYEIQVFASSVHLERNPRYVNYA